MNDLKRKKVISEFLNIFQKEKDYLHSWSNYLQKLNNVKIFHILIQARLDPEDFRKSFKKNG